MRIKVESYSGYKADQRPLRFYLGEQVLNVEEVLDQWYSPDDTWFRVQASDGNVYILKHSFREEEPAWTLEAFRAS
ncbi:MAG: hypothetical protein IRZ15_15375 [Bryobacteraceae bacterium]|nr:hypothetical protein [Bryobacteraceae bacterium]